MDDLISREKALEELEDWERCYTWDEHCRESKEDYIVSPSDVIVNLPSEQPKWTPRSEKLPEERTKVLATVLVPHRESIVISAEYLMNTFYCDNGDCWMADDEEVVAWMPLPQPYKGEQE
jgi:hypothetical protein